MEISTSHHLSQPESHDDCLLLAEEQKMIDIEEPHHNDVLCGRGVTTNRHPGNESFRSLVGLNKVRHKNLYFGFLVPVDVRLHYDARKIPNGILNCTIGRISTRTSCSRRDFVISHEILDHDTLFLWLVSGLQSTNKSSNILFVCRLKTCLQEVYVSSTKRQKMSISRSIVEAVRSLDPPGRFLEKNPETGLWSEIGHKKAVEKTSQALRDGAASLRKQLSADLGDPDFLNAVFDFDQEALLQDSAPRSKSASPKGKGNKFVSDGIENNKSSRKKQSLFVKKVSHLSSLMFQTKCEDLPLYFVCRQKLSQ